MEEMTFGAELELADIDQTRPLPTGFGWDRRDYSMVNSTGIAVDPKGILHNRGGEINTPPASSLAQQRQHFEQALDLFPEAKVNYRSNLHIHIRLPGLKDDLAALKRLQHYTHQQLKPMIDEIEHIPVPREEDYESPEAWTGAMQRYRRRRKSHHTFLSKGRVAWQLAAQTIKEFMEREVPMSYAGKPLWHAQSRCCVNIRQLRETDTIEFRHFPGTLNVQQFMAATEWCQQYLQAALCSGQSVESLWENFKLTHRLPSFEPYQHRLEVRYKLTCADGTVPRAERERNIKCIAEGLEC